MAKTITEKTDYDLAVQSLEKIATEHDETMAQRARWYLHELYNSHGEELKAATHASDPYVKDRLQLKQNVCIFIQNAQKLLIEEGNYSEGSKYLGQGMDEIEKLQNEIDDHRYYLVDQLEEIKTLISFLEVQVRTGVDVQCDRPKRSLLWGRSIVLADKICGQKPQGALVEFEEAQKSKDPAVVEEAGWRGANLCLQMKNVQGATDFVVKAIHKLEEKETSVPLMKCIVEIYKRIQMGKKIDKKFIMLENLLNAVLEKKGLLLNIQNRVKQIIHQEDCDSLD